MARSVRLKSTGMKQPALVARNSKSSASSRNGGRSRASKRYVVCVSNEDYPASLERCKIYIVLSDSEARSVGMLRIVDESGEDYLYPKSMFADIKVPPVLAKALAATT
jgi:hypothetical protein